MTDESPKQLDPRFDPAFQRGFDGAPPQPQRTTGYLRSNPVPVSTPARVVEVAQEPRSVAVIDDEGTDELADDAAEEFAPRSGRNPFLIALAAISLILIIGGLWAVQFMRSKFLTPDISTDVDYVTMQTAITGAPIAIALGIAIGVGVMFVYAISWQRRRVL